MAQIPLLGACRMPAFGIGTYGLGGETCTEAVRTALQTGFRLIDTAAGYHNEALVGEGIRQSGVPRASLFVVVKLTPKSFTSEDKVEASVRLSIEKLGISYADLVLLQWPGCGGRRPEDAAGHSAGRRRAYGVLRALQKEGCVKWLGVSNFLPRHFADIGDVCGHTEGLRHGEDGPRDYPVVNQVELHPLCVQADVLAHAAAHHMVVQQYSPLGQGKPALLQHPGLVSLVETHFRSFTAADVLVMWGLAQGFCTLVRSASPSHTVANWRAGQAFFGEGLLSAEQRRVLTELRERMGVAEAQDEHFCWFSSEIA